MEVVLAPGDTLRVTLKEADGEFTIKWGKNSLKVESDLEDTVGRKGVIYEEKFGKPDPREKEVTGLLVAPHARTKLLPTRNAVTRHTDFKASADFLHYRPDAAGAFGNAPTVKELSELPENTIIVLSISRLAGNGMIPSMDTCVVKSSRHWWPDPDNQPHNGWTHGGLQEAIRDFNYTWGVYKPR